MADRANCVWVSAIYKCSGSIQVRRKATLTINKGSTIRRDPAELHFIDQRCQIDLKSTLCVEPGATPFSPMFECLSCDFRSQALSRFFPASEKKLRGAWGRGSTIVRIGSS